MLTSEISDDEIESERISGEISLVLENGSVEEKASMLRLLRQFKTPGDYAAVRDSYGLTDAGTTTNQD